MDETELAPDPQLMESMRAVGYTLETAVADVIDNSITAGARKIDVHYAAAPQPHVAILDDGHGMEPSQLIEAMRLAGKSPLQTRVQGDLGRFGLGLKTASISQCRELTVVTKTSNGLHGARWSLNHLAQTGRWALLLLDSSELEHLPHFDALDAQNTGTLVLWDELDQLRAQSADLPRHMDSEMARVRDHLALVFHRFVARTENPLQFHVNGVALPKVDPFLTSHRGTQRGPAETFTVQGQLVAVQPYTLPYLSKLSVADRKRARIAGALRESQGFYIYRSDRLVIWGSWFRIVPKDDLGKLARVQVDIPNSLDHLWSLDIKKSTAAPPPEVRSVLRRLAERIVHPSRTTHLYRGRKVPTQDPVLRLWDVVEERDTFRYQVNRDHPAVSTLATSLNKRELTLMQRLIEALESSFPVEDAYNRLGTDVPHKPTDVEQGAAADLARGVWDVYQQQGHSAEEFARRMAGIEPWAQMPNAEVFLLEVAR